MAHTIRISDEAWIAAAEYGRSLPIQVTPHKVLTEAVRIFLQQVEAETEQPKKSRNKKPAA